MDIENKNIAILGVGVEGLALVDFLKNKNCRITVFDRKNEKELIEVAEEETRDKIKSVISDPKITYKFGSDDFDLSNFDIIFRSPGVNINHPNIVKAKSLGVEISSQIKLFFDLCPCRIIGVTGTKGKGTTASLIYSILKQCASSEHPFASSHPSQPIRPSDSTSIPQKEIPSSASVYLAGNIGTPAISLIPKLKSDDIVILELSSFQLADISKSPNIAVVTNLDVDHLDYHKDEKEYHQAKFNILSNQTEIDFVVLNYESTFPKDWISRVKSSKVYFSSTNREAKAFIENEGGPYRVILNKDGQEIKICDQSEIKLVGKHNLLNIAAATIVADILKVSPEIISKAVRDFAGLPHRLEIIGETAGVKYINDSFATTPGPTMAAIDSFDQTKILILGGSSKGADFSSLAKKISQNEIKAVVLIGAEADKIEQALLKENYQGKILAGGSTMEQIVTTAKSVAKSGDIIIFSPACASFDMFKNYKDRGEKFKTAILNLKSEILISKSETNLNS